MLLAWSSRLHLAAGLLVALFLVMAIGQAAADGFQVERDRYAASKPLNQGSTARYVLGLFPNARGRTILILDAAEDDPIVPAEGGTSLESLAKLESRLTQAGMRVRRSRGADAMPLLDGVEVLLYAHPMPRYLELDPAELAPRLKSPLVLDNTGLLDSAAFDAADLVYLNLVRMFWPHWLDPEMEAFADYVVTTVPEEDGILMLPGSRLTSTASRARWYLPLNVRLLPRRLYMWRPEMGTSFVTTYYEWVSSYNEAAPWKGTRKIRMEERSLSKLEPSAPTRTLTAEEKEAARTHDVQWILFFNHQPDFLLSHWELVRLETVLAWDRMPGVPR